MIESASSARWVRDAVCLGCGCLCDDIEVHVENQRLIEARNACEQGIAWFRRGSIVDAAPDATIDGEAASREEAVARAVELLAHARSAVVLGLTHATIEAQRQAVALADHCGADIDPAHSAWALPWRLASQRVGHVSATLGEVKNRADLVVYWACDPLTSHPRHWERYAVEPIGRFVPRGRADRRVVVVDSLRTATAAQADVFVPVPEHEHLQAFSALRALLRPALERNVRVSLAARWGVLAEALHGARYAAFFLGERLGQLRGGRACVESALALVRELNMQGPQRCVALSLGGSANCAGIETVLGWQAGAPLAVDFSRGFPRFLPDEASTESLLTRKAVDLALIVADGDLPDLSQEAKEHLESIPTIVVAPDATDRARSPRPTVGLASAAAGLHARGTVMRCDGVCLPLRPAFGSGRLSEAELLLAIARRLHAPSSPEP